MYEDRKLLINYQIIVRILIKDAVYYHLINAWLLILLLIINMSIEGQGSIKN